MPSGYMIYNKLKVDHSPTLQRSSYNSGICSVITLLRQFLQ